jgi:hypothetical protein
LGLGRVYISDFTRAAEGFRELISQTKPNKIFAPVIAIHSFEGFKETWTEIEKRVLFEALVVAGASQILLPDDLKKY